MKKDDKITYKRANNKDIIRGSEYFKDYKLLKNIDKISIDKDFETINEFINELKKIDINLLLDNNNKDCLFIKNNKSYARKDKNGDYFYISFKEESTLRVLFGVVDILQIMYGLRFTKLILKLMFKFDVKIKQLEWWEDERDKIFNNIDFLNDEESMEIHNEMFYDYYKNYLFFLKEFQLIGLNNVFHTDKKGNPIFFASTRHMKDYLKRNNIKFSISQINRVINSMATTGIINKVNYEDIDNKLTKISKINIEKYEKFNDISFYSLESLTPEKVNSIIEKIEKLKDNKVSVMKTSKKNVRKSFSSYTANKIFNNQSATGKHQKAIKLPF